mmetsp:Transcript_38680/g.70433  ORF Transcript_38680/g.70433 Transcript_38680/m.70433 type:complete len:260 (-) Transcript_38680:66-845(-)
MATPAASTFILVLGQSLNPDGTAPQVILQRAQTAATLYSTVAEGRALVLVSGADVAGVGVTEAEIMASVLVDAGVPPAAIIQDRAARTTFENAKNCVKLMMGNMPKEVEPLDVQIHLVTSDFHMPRALLIFRTIVENSSTILKDMPLLGAPAASNLSDDISEDPGREMLQFGPTYKPRCNINEFGAFERLCYERFLVPIMKKRFQEKYAIAVKPTHLQTALDQLDGMIGALRTNGPDGVLRACQDWVSKDAPPISQDVQ